MDKNKIISKETIVLETPPNAEKLKMMNNDELRDICKSLQVPREQYEGKDEDKNRIFMINEILRLRPPVPPIERPVLIERVYDEEKMQKTLTFRYLKHIMNNKEYKHSVKTLESYKEPLYHCELNNKDKENLVNSIQSEVSGLNLEEYLTKEAVLDFACNNGKSSGEKRKRVNALLNAIQPLLREKLLDDIQKYEENKYVLDDKGKKKKNIKPKYNHIRITNYDISVY
tara:strand:+ start:284 stop:967 length:684 start_codon:yes stop_codon:yes gene_type:complete